MNNTEHAQPLRELGRFCENSPLEGAIDFAGRAYTAAAEIEGRRVPSDDELLALVPQLKKGIDAPVTDFNSFCYKVNDPPIYWYPGDFIASPQALIFYARAVLARLGGGEIEGRGQQYPPLHRWNFETREDGLYACRHLHDKGQHCEYERLTETMVREGARFGGGEGQS